MPCKTGETVSHPSLNILSKALIIFVRNPVPGKVKTRLAKTLGNDVALKIYERLLLHTRDVALGVNARRFVFYQDYLNTDDIWHNEHFEKVLQEGEDLGDRMKVAFQYLFDRQFENVVIIGSDCITLTTQIIMEAFESLNNRRCVIGPATDGGYYLLGLAENITGVFKNKSWSSPRLFQETALELQQAGIPFATLQTLPDIDHEEDIDWNLFPGIKAQ